MQSFFTLIFLNKPILSSANFWQSMIRDKCYNKNFALFASNFLPFVCGYRRIAGAKSQVHFKENIANP